MAQYFAYVMLEVIPGQAHATFCVECSDPSVNKAEINDGSRALQYFLRNGWVPVRESAPSAQGQLPHVYSLLLLSR